MAKMLAKREVESGRLELVELLSLGYEQGAEGDAHRAF